LQGADQIYTMIHDFLPDTGAARVPTQRLFCGLAF
jgi:hypothetical protein